MSVCFMLHKSCPGFSLPHWIIASEGGGSGQLPEWGGLCSVLHMRLSWALLRQWSWSWELCWEWKVFLIPKAALFVYEEQGLRLWARSVTLHQSVDRMEDLPILRKMGGGEKDGRAGCQTSVARRQCPDCLLLQRPGPSKFLDASLDFNLTLAFSF